MQQTRSHRLHAPDTNRKQIPKHVDGFGVTGDARRGLAHEVARQLVRKRFAVSSFFDGMGDPIRSKQDLNGAVTGQAVQSISESATVETLDAKEWQAGEPERRGSSRTRPRARLDVGQERRELRF